MTFGRGASIADVGRSRHGVGMAIDEVRPKPAEVVDERALRRWYWLKSELVEIARAEHISTAGGKLELTERIAAHFSGRALPPTWKESSGDFLPLVLTPDTVIESGQRCTQTLRGWMRSRIGPAFSFDAATRASVRAGGITLRDLEQLWQEPRPRASEPAAQFELNRFSRSWHSAHPGRSHAAMLAAWKSHRSLPRD